MLDKDAIQAIQASEATKAVADAISEGLARTGSVFCAPDSFNVHDLEKYMPIRRRASGVMTTASVEDFSGYSVAHKEGGAAVFIDAESMRATSVLNLGTIAAPGHADKLAVLKLQQTAAYKALMQIVNGPKKQADVAEFIEDWQGDITCYEKQEEPDVEPGTIRISHAVEAIRTITLESLKKMETSVGDFEESHGTLDSVKATAKQKLPARIVFEIEPYQGLEKRKFELRVGILTSDKPMVQLRIIKAEDHQQEMANELVKLLGEKISDSMPVHIGVYQKA